MTVFIDIFFLEVVWSNDFIRWNDTPKCNLFIFCWYFLSLMGVCWAPNSNIIFVHFSFHSKDTLIIKNDPIEKEASNWLFFYSDCSKRRLWFLITLFEFLNESVSLLKWIYPVSKLSVNWALWSTSIRFVYVHWSSWLYIKVARNLFAHLHFSLKACQLRVRNSTVRCFWKFCTHLRIAFWESGLPPYVLRYNFCVWLVGLVALPQVIQFAFCWIKNVKSFGILAIASQGGYSDFIALIYWWEKAWL